MNYVHMIVAILFFYIYILVAIVAMVNSTTTNGGGGNSSAANMTDTCPLPANSTDSGDSPGPFNWDEKEQVTHVQCNCHISKEQHLQLNRVSCYQSFSFVSRSFPRLATKNKKKMAR